jgi:hypothetical protein
VLSGDRDWVIYLQCHRDGVVLHPAGRWFPQESLAHSPEHNRLLKEVRQMVQRRQAALPAGQALRVQVRFLVPPDARLIFHQAYAVLKPLKLPTSQQELQPGDDVSAILAGR